MEVTYGDIEGSAATAHFEVVERLLSCRKVSQTRQVVLEYY